MKNAHGRTCKKTKVYIYLYISLYENLFENGCVYIYIYIFIYIYIYICLCIWSYCYRSHRPPRPLYILENLFQQPLHRRVPIDLFPCYTQRGSTWTGLVLECSASLLYLEEFQSSCMFLSPLGDLLLRLLRSSKPMFKWVDRVVLCPPNGSINVNWGLFFGWILKTSLIRQESIVMHLSGS